MCNYDFISISIAKIWLQKKYAFKMSNIIIEWLIS